MTDSKGEVGEVIALEDNRLVVKLQRNEACAKCRACTAGLESKEMIIKAINECNGKIGDNVEIALDSADFFRATLIMYGIPFVMFMIGIFAGYYGALRLGVSYAELTGMVLGVLLVVISYGVIHTQEKHFKATKYIPKAINVIKH